MRKQLLIAAIIICLVLSAGCSAKNESSSTGYTQISQAEAKEMMDEGGVIVLDVREPDEYNSGHIPGAVLFPVGSINAESAEEFIPEKDSVLLVYCRSGNRSKTASATLVSLGYTAVFEFGGISTWPYDIVVP